MLTSYAVKQAVASDPKGTLLTRYEAAQLLGVTAVQIRWWEGRGLAPAMRTASGEPLFDMKTLTAFAKSAVKTRKG